MSLYHTGNVQPSLDLEEHASKGNVNAKRTQLYGYVPGTDSLVPISAVDNGDGTFSFNSTSNRYIEKAGLTAGALNADLQAALDVSAFNTGSFQLTALATGGVITIQGSNDGVTYFTVQATNINSVNPSPQSTISATGVYIFDINFRYLRIRQTSWTSGSSTGVLELYGSNAIALVQGSVSVTGNPAVVGNVAAAAADSGNPVKIGGKYNATLPTYATGNRGDAQLDPNGRLLTGLAASRLTLLASTAETVSTVLGALTGLGSYREALITVNVTAVSGTSPTMQANIQVSDDGGTTWYNHPDGAFTLMTTTGAQVAKMTVFGDTMRLSLTIGGTTPSFTMAVKGVFK